MKPCFPVDFQKIFAKNPCASKQIRSDNIV